MVTGTLLFYMPLHLHNRGTVYVPWLQRSFLEMIVWDNINPADSLIKLPRQNKVNKVRKKPSGTHMAMVLD